MIAPANKPLGRSDDNPEKQPAQNPVQKSTHGGKSPVRFDRLPRAPKDTPDRQETWIRASQQLHDDHPRRVIPPELREDYRRSTSLERFWQDCQDGQLEPIGTGQRTRATVAKDRIALNRWRVYTCPQNWQNVSDFCWPGPSLEAITPGLLDATFAIMLMDLSPATVKSTQSHINTLLHHAVKLGALTTAPKSRPIKVPDQTTAILTLRQINAIVYALDTPYVLLTAYAANPRPWKYRPVDPHDHQLLQIAFILAINTGLRASDLFRITWRSPGSDRTRSKYAYVDPHGPAVEIHAIKTGKQQRIPLAPTTWRHLERLKKLRPGPPASPYLFPGYSQPDANDPERTAPARRRTALFKLLLHAIGIHHLYQPWQTCRATANERYETHPRGQLASGLGQFLLGHNCHTINAKSYREPSQAVLDGVRSIRQPASFTWRRHVRRLLRKVTHTKALSCSHTRK